MCGRVAGGCAMAAQAEALGCREKGAGLDVSQVTAGRLRNSSRSLLSRNKNKRCTDTQMETNPQWRRQGRPARRPECSPHTAAHRAGAERGAASRGQTGAGPQAQRPLAPAQPAPDPTHARARAHADSRRSAPPPKGPSPRPSLSSPFLLPSVSPRPLSTLRGLGGSGPEGQGSGRRGSRGSPAPPPTPQGGSPDALPALRTSDCSGLRGAAVRSGAGRCQAGPINARARPAGPALPAPRPHRG